MTKGEIEAALERVRNWPAARQEEAAIALLDLERMHTEVLPLSPEDEAALRIGIGEADRGEFASAGDVAALFNRYRTR